MFQNTFPLSLSLSFTDRHCQAIFRTFISAPQKKKSIYYAVSTFEIGGYDVSLCLLRTAAAVSYLRLFHSESSLYQTLKIL